MKSRLEALGVETEFLINYSTGHAVPQNEADLQQMYQFMLKHLSTTTGIDQQLIVDCQQPVAIYDLLGRKVNANSKGIRIQNGQLFIQKK